MQGAAILCLILTGVHIFHTGGVSAWVLYVPEEGGAPRQVAVYLPFTAKWEFPPTEQEGQMQVSCRI